MNSKILAKLLWVALLGFGFINPVNATVFAIDSFTVLKNDSVLFEDNFDDGVLPPSTGQVFPNGNEAVYSTVGTPGPEVGGKLYLDTALGDPRPSEVTGTDLLFQRSRLVTQASDDNPASGLKIHHDIMVMGLFDLIAPELELERYGIRLTDFATNNVANDNVEVGVRRTSSGDVTVALRQADFAASQMLVLEQVVLSAADFIDYDQILLALWNPANSAEVHAAYLLGSGGEYNDDPFLFSATGEIYHGEGWTRAAFVASQVVVSGVPEPASIVLMLVGLTGLGFVRKTK
jgi:hypothetical protein